MDSILILVQKKQLVFVCFICLFVVKLENLAHFQCKCSTVKVIPGKLKTSGFTTSNPGSLLNILVISILGDNNAQHLRSFGKKI